MSLPAGGVRGPVQSHHGTGGAGGLDSWLAAGVVSAPLLSVAKVTVYAIPFLAQNPLALKDCPLGNSVWGGGTPWFNWTYGQYLAVLTGIVLAPGIGTGAVPLFMVMDEFFATWVVDGAFFFRPAWDVAAFDVSKGAEAICIVVLLTVDTALTGWSSPRQKKLER